MQGDYFFASDIDFYRMMKEPRWDGGLELIESSNQNHQRGEEMQNQTVLPFKLESTLERLTAHAGLAVFGEFCSVMKLSEQVNRYLRHRVVPKVSNLRLCTASGADAVWRRVFVCRAMIMDYRRY